MTKNTWLMLALIAIVAAAMFFFTPWSIPAAGRKFAALFQRAEYTHGVPQHLLARMALQESAYDPKARSSAGAEGIMQIVPRWHPGVNPFDVSQAIDYAGSLMRKHFVRFGTWSKALAAYNAGPGALQNRINKHGVNWLAHMPAETQNYVARITNDVRVT